MKSSRRVFRLLAALLGAIGVVACLVGVVIVWNVRNRLDETLTTTLDRCDVALSRVAERAQQTNQTIVKMRGSFHKLNDRVQRHVATLGGGANAEPADIEQIERQLYASLEQTKAWMELMHSTADFVEQLTHIVNSTFLRDDSQVAKNLVVMVRDGNEEFKELSTLFEEVQHQLEEIRTDQNVDDNTKRFETLYARVDGSLESIEGHGRNFKAGVTATRAAAEDFGADIRAKMTVIAVVSNLLLLWMLAAQLSLFLHGYSWQPATYPKRGQEL